MAASRRESPNARPFALLTVTLWESVDEGRLAFAVVSLLVGAPLSVR
jgi:hypothetical protein